MSASVNKPVASKTTVEGSGVAEGGGGGGGPEPQLLVAVSPKPPVRSVVYVPGVIPVKSMLLGLHANVPPVTVMKSKLSPADGVKPPMKSRLMLPSKVVRYKVCKRTSKERRLKTPEVI